MAIYGRNENSQRQAREENIVDLTPLLGRDVLEMQAVARELHHLYENACNCGLTPAQEKRQERLETRAAYIAAMAKLPLMCQHQRDPRGWPLIVTDTSKRDWRVCPF